MALPSAASLSSAGLSRSKSSMMPCIVSCGCGLFSPRWRCRRRRGRSSARGRPRRRRRLEQDKFHEFPPFPLWRGIQHIPRNPASRHRAHIWSVAAPRNCLFPRGCDIVSPDGAPEPRKIQGEGTTMAVIKVTDIAYVRLRSPDLDLQSEFLENFGLAPSAKTGKAIYYRATDPVHHVHVTEKGDPSSSVSLITRRARTISRRWPRRPAHRASRTWTSPAAASASA